MTTKSKETKIKTRRDRQPKGTAAKPNPSTHEAREGATDAGLSWLDEEPTSYADLDLKAEKAKYAKRYDVIHLWFVGSIMTNLWLVVILAYRVWG
ncbi:MAG: hypothetical protein WA991_03820 [Ornithinimicrobium sp.]